MMECLTSRDDTTLLQSCLIISAPDETENYQALDQFRAANLLAGDHHTSDSQDVLSEHGLTSYTRALENVPHYTLSRQDENTICEANVDKRFNIEFINEIDKDKTSSLDKTEKPKQLILQAKEAELRECYSMETLNPDDVDMSENIVGVRQNAYKLGSINASIELPVAVPISARCQTVRANVEEKQEEWIRTEEIHNRLNICNSKPCASGSTMEYRCVIKPANDFTTEILPTISILPPPLEHRETIPILRSVCTTSGTSRTISLGLKSEEHFLAPGVVTTWRTITESATSISTISPGLFKKENLALPQERNPWTSQELMDTQRSSVAPLSFDDLPVKGARNPFYFISQGELEEFAAASMDFESGACTICNRLFKVDRLAVHQNVCTKLSYKAAKSKPTKSLSSRYNKGSHIDAPNSSPERKACQNNMYFLGLASKANASVAAVKSLDTLIKQAPLNVPTPARVQALQKAEKQKVEAQANNSEAYAKVKKQQLSAKDTDKRMMKYVNSLQLSSANSKLDKSHRAHCRPEDRWRLQASEACSICKRKFSPKVIEQHVDVCSRAANRIKADTNLKKAGANHFQKFGLRLNSTDSQRKTSSSSLLPKGSREDKRLLEISMKRKANVSAHTCHPANSYSASCDEIKRIIRGKANCKAALEYSGSAIQPPAIRQKSGNEKTYAADQALDRESCRLEEATTEFPCRGVRLPNHTSPEKMSSSDYMAFPAKILCLTNCLGICTEEDRHRAASTEHRRGINNAQVLVLCMNSEKKSFDDTRCDKCGCQRLHSCPDSGAMGNSGAKQADCLDTTGCSVEGVAEKPHREISYSSFVHSSCNECESTGSCAESVADRKSKRTSSLDSMYEILPFEVVDAKDESKCTSVDKDASDKDSLEGSKKQAQALAENGSSQKCVEAQSTDVSNIDDGESGSTNDVGKATLGTMPQEQEPLQRQSKVELPVLDQPPVTPRRLAENSGAPVDKNDEKEKFEGMDKPNFDEVSPKAIPAVDSGPHSTSLLTSSFQNLCHGIKAHSFNRSRSQPVKLMDDTNKPTQIEFYASKSERTLYDNEINGLEAASFGKATASEPIYPPMYISKLSDTMRKPVENQEPCQPSLNSMLQNPASPLSRLKQPAAPRFPDILKWNIRPATEKLADLSFDNSIQAHGSFTGRAGPAFPTPPLLQSQCSPYQDLHQVMTEAKRLHQILPYRHFNDTVATEIVRPPYQPLPQQPYIPGSAENGAYATTHRYFYQPTFNHEPSLPYVPLSEKELTQPRHNNVGINSLSRYLCLPRRHRNHASGNSIISQLPCSSTPSNVRLV